MPSAKSDVVLAAPEILGDLMATGLLPSSALDVFFDSECLPNDRRLDEQEQVAPIGIPSSVFRSLEDLDDPTERGMRERFLGRMSGRRLIHLHVLKEAGDLEGIIAFHDGLEARLRDVTDPDRFARTHGVLVLVFHTRVDPAILDRVRAWGAGRLPGCQTARFDRVYLMDARLRTSAEGVMVESKHVWAEAVAQLLLRLPLTPDFQVGGELIWAWRCIQFGPIFDRSGIVHDYDKALKDKLHEEVASENLPKLFREFKPVTGSAPRKQQNEAKESDGTDDSIRWRDFLKDKGDVEDRIDAAFKVVDPEGETVKQDRRRKRQARMDEAGRRIEDYERKAWEKVGENPAYLPAFWKHRARQETHISEEIDEQRSRWNTALDHLGSLGTLRSRIDKTKEIVATAARHHVDLRVRLLFGVASFMALLYVVVVVSNAIGMFEELDGFVKMLSIMLGGLSGVLAAIAITMAVERNAGKKGADMLEAQVSRELSPVRSSVFGMSQLIRGGDVIAQRIRWEKSVRVTSELGRRTSLIMEGVLNITAIAEENLSASRMDPLWEQDRAVYRKGTAVQLCKVDVNDIALEVSAELKNFDSEHWVLICRAWTRLFTEIDGENRGYLPEPRLRARWQSVVARERSGFTARVVKRLLGRHSRRVQLEGLGESIRQLDGNSPATRPFLSCRLLSDEVENESVRIVVSREYDSLRAISEELARSGRPVGQSLHVPDLPVYGINFEEMPLRRSAPGGEGSS